MAQIVPATEEWIAQAAEIIRRGGLVALPTETVYGLGANALDPAAVQRIFAAKGRPTTNPLIVHIADSEQVPDLTEGSSPYTSALTAAFWPGPLTLILSRRANLPDIVTAGGPTVAIRMPNHPVALELLRRAGVPIAAPSANRSESISPTRAEHVAESLGDAVDLILDGGACEVGLESSVLSLAADPPVILRPGAIRPEQIEQVIGVKPQILHAQTDAKAPMASPGQMRRHYAPSKPLTISREPIADSTGSLPRIGLLLRSGADIETTSLAQAAAVRILPDEPSAYAREFYNALHELDSNPRVEQILVQSMPETEDWLAVRDRLSRAAAPRERLS